MAKYPEYDGGSHSGYLFELVCFFVGIAFLTVFSLGQIRLDDRDGPGFNPFTKMPDGKIGISEFGASAVGFGVLMGLGLFVIAVL